MSQGCYGITIVGLGTAHDNVVGVSTCTCTMIFYHDESLFSSVWVDTSYYSLLMAH